VNVFRLLAGLIRVLLRSVWGTVYVIGLRLRCAIWGASAFEHAVFHAPPWLALVILKAYGAQIGPEIDFHGRLQLHGTYVMRDKLFVGRRCHIGPHVTLDLTAPIRLEDRVTLALNSRIYTHLDVGYSPLAAVLYPTQTAPVVIETGAYVGGGAAILMGVRVGRCSVVAAGAVVLEDVPPYSVVAGVPARVVKQLDPKAVEV
jgi:acetyltransferase-like isoleucine patch superfamily enzyme